VDRPLSAVLLVLKIRNWAC